MFKIFKKAIALICALSMLTILSACNEGTQKETEAQTTEKIYYTVTFNSNGGTPVSSQKVEKDQFLTEPPQPTNEGKIFSHWENGERHWQFPSNRVRSDMTLYAVWLEARVVFKTQNDAESDTCAITGLVDTRAFECLYVPEKIKGFTCTAIADGAFEGYNAEYADKIVFPDTIISVGENAFSGIEEIEIEFSGKLKYILQSSFENCKTLKEISFDEGMDKIPVSAFSGCTSLEKATLPKGILTIEDDAFNDCTALKTLVLPETLTEIQNGAFRDCKSLKTVFFGGSEEQYNAIKTADFNDSLEKAAVYFYSEAQPAEAGNYWHYSSTGTPILWN